MVWNLWAKYFALNAYVAEGHLASQVLRRGEFIRVDIRCPVRVERDHRNEKASLIQGLF